MSLCCHETGVSLGIDEELWCASREDSHAYSAVSDAVVSRIPEGLRRPAPCRPGDGGLDVHRLVGPRGTGRFVSFGTTSFGPFVFSVSVETARTYFPRLHATYARAGA